MRTQPAYWNAFGREDPSVARNLSISAEIVIAHDGAYRRDSGLFLEDEAGHVWVGHRGRVHGGSKGFLDCYAGDVVSTMTAGTEERVALVGELDASLPAALDAFVRRVEQFKNAIKQGLPQVVRDWRSRSEALLMKYKGTKGNSPDEWIASLGRPFEEAWTNASRKTAAVIARVIDLSEPEHARRLEAIRQSLEIDKQTWDEYLPIVLSSMRDRDLIWLGRQFGLHAFLGN